MKSIKLPILIALFIFVFSVVGCSENKGVGVEKTHMDESNFSDNGTIKTQVNSLLSYQQYENMFKNFTKDLSIPNFILKNSSISPHVTKVDKKLTFGKREYLSLDGKWEDSNTKPTTNLLIFENKNQSTQIVIRIDFTTSYIGEDMIDWTSTSGYQNTNTEFSKQIDLVILSYKNLIISIQQSALEEVSADTTKVVIEEIISKIKKY